MLVCYQKVISHEASVMPRVLVIVHLGLENICRILHLDYFSIQRIHKPYVKLFHLDLYIFGLRNQHYIWTVFAKLNPPSHGCTILENCTVAECGQVNNLSD